MSFSVLCSKENKELKYIDSLDFYYANSKRYSITGDLPLAETSTDVYKIGIFSAVNIGIFTAQHIAQKNTIWADGAKFRIIEDGNYALYADKGGHIIGAYLTSKLYADMFSEIGINWELSNILGSAMGIAYSGYIEIMDGYGENFGFSPSDMYANIFGSSFFLLQYYVPFLQNFTPKFTYIPADWHGDNRRQPHFAFIDDYSSHTMWMSLNVNNILPNQYKKYWPKWLQLSFGFAVRNLCDPSNPNFDCANSRIYDSNVAGNPKFILALDYNLVEIFPEMGAPFDWIIQSLNVIKFPAPAIEFGETTQFKLLYPFSF